MVISGDWLFGVLTFLAVFFTWFSFLRPNILISLVAGMFWFSLFMWLFFSTSAPLGLTENFEKILVWIFLVLTFVPFLAHMDTEIQHEKDGVRWRAWGRPPITKVDHRAEYQKEFRRRVGRKF